MLIIYYNNKYLGGDYMNNIYDIAHQLARAIKNSDEYKTFIQKRDIVYSNEKNKEMVENFKKKAMDIQIQKMSGKKVEDEEIEKLQKLEEILRLNPTINDYLIAEFRFSQLVQDISNIIGEAINIDEK